MKKITLLLLNLLLLIAAPFVAAQEEELLDPQVAFALSVEVVDNTTLLARWDIAEGYYLYRSKFKFQSNTPGAALGEAVLPPGKLKQDEFFGEIETYRHSVEARLPIEWLGNPAAAISISITSQGCADLGVCYPPQRQQFELALPPPQLTSSAPTGGAQGLLKQLGAGGGSGLGGGSGDDEILPPEQAFPLEVVALDGNTLVARWNTVPGHYLYRDKFAFSLEGAEGITLAEPQLPKGEEKDDEFFGRIEVYHNPVEARLPLQRDKLDATEVTLLLKYQGCADIGICYPPQKQRVTLQLPAGKAGAAPAAGNRTTVIKAPRPAAPLSEQDSLAASLAGGNTLATIALFFGLGLLLAFTPCVFPMIPILSSIIVGQGEGLTTRRAFTLSLVYVLAMALTYTVAGVIAGLFGANLQAAFQNPWILSSFAAVFVALSLSMFGFFELQLPSSLQGKLAMVSNRQQGGTLAGVAVMGLLSALIVGPCVAPPLMGALIYIGQTGDAVLGGLALFALSLGMGAPLLAIGVSAGKFLPRAGGWMDAVKAVFGVLLLAVAIWMLERILPAAITLLLWALLLITSAVYMGAVDAVKEGASGWHKLWKGLGLVLLLQGALMMAGLAVGNSDPLQPLKGLGTSAGVAQAQHLQFKRIKSAADLQREIKAASAAGKTVMLDFYADWCVSCKEFEKYVFADPQVLAALSNTVSLQADVTANDEADQALLKQFGLIGPPGIILYDRAGQELRDYRIVGYMEAGEFAAHLQRALKP